jgi:metal-responsive CopG/Arc/MetJ family transcriptional regulator
MATISVRLKDEILEELNEHSRKLHIPRAEYVRRAVVAMNKQVDKELRRERIMAASKRVREESMHINVEFDAVEDVPDV